MADTRLSDLHPAGALSASDLFYVVQTPGSGGEKATGTQLLALVGTAYVPLAGGTMTGALTTPAGAVGAPSLMFTGAGATTGVYSAGLNDLSFAVDGVRRGTFNVDGFTTTGGLQTLNTDGFLRLGLSGTDIFLTRVSTTRLQVRTQAPSPIALELNSLFTDASNYERLTLTGVAGTSVNITAESLGTGSPNLDVVITPKGTGKVRFPDGSATQLAVCFTATTNTGIFAAVSGTRFGIVSNGTFSLNVASNFVAMPTATVHGWTSVGGADGSAIDTGTARNAAGIVEVNNGTAGTYRDLKLRNLLQTAYQEVTEMTAPSAPAANSVRIYAEDNGSGKTRLMALFATGAAQQIAIEP